MKRLARRSLAMAIFGLMFVSALIVTDKIYPSDTSKSKKKLVFIENNVKFGEEKPIIIPYEGVEPEGYGTLWATSINPNPGPTPPDTSKGY